MAVLFILKKKKKKRERDAHGRFVILKAALVARKKKEGLQSVFETTKQYDAVSLKAIACPFEIGS